MSPETILEIQKWLVYATVPAAVGFPVWYHLKLHWNSSPMGRHVMGYSVVVGLLYASTLVQMWWPTRAFQLYGNLVLTALMLIVVWWRVIVFVSIYRTTRRERLGQSRKDRSSS